MAERTEELYMPREFPLRRKEQNSCHQNRRIKKDASKRNGVMKQATLDRVFWITMMNRPIL
jgi:hypothetical protein